MPDEQGAWSDREDPAPAPPGYQRRQGNEPEPISRLVADRTGQLPPQDRVLVPQHEQFRVLAGVAAQQPAGTDSSLRGTLHSRETTTQA